MGVLQDVPGTLDGVDQGLPVWYLSARGIDRTQDCFDDPDAFGDKIQISVAGPLIQGPQLIEISLHGGGNRGHRLDLGHMCAAVERMKRTTDRLGDLRLIPRLIDLLDEALERIQVRPGFRLKDLRQHRVQGDCRLPFLAQIGLDGRCGEIFRLRLWLGLASRNIERLVDLPPRGCDFLGVGAQVYQIRGHTLAPRGLRHLERRRGRRCRLVQTRRCRRPRWFASGQGKRPIHQLFDRHPVRLTGLLRDDQRRKDLQRAIDNLENFRARRHAALDDPVQQVLNRPGVLADVGRPNQTTTAFQGVEGAPESAQGLSIFLVSLPAGELLTDHTELLAGLLEEDLNDLRIPLLVSRDRGRLGPGKVFASLHLKREIRLGDRYRFSRELGRPRRLLRLASDCLPGLGAWKLPCRGRPRNDRHRGVGRPRRRRQAKTRGGLAGHIEDRIGVKLALGHCVGIKLDAGHQVGHRILGLGRELAPRSDMAVDVPGKPVHHPGRLAQADDLERPRDRAEPTRDVLNQGQVLRPFQKARDCFLGLGQLTAGFLQRSLDQELKLARGEPTLDVLRTLGR